MRNILDFSSWPALLSTVMGLLIASLLMVGIRLIFMQTMQRRRERENRQINERLKTLIAAYKTLGGSFTGELQVNPAHRRDVRDARDGRNLSTMVPSGPGSALGPDGADEVSVAAAARSDTGPDAPSASGSSARQRRIRDAVEAALSDVILLGTEEQVQLAATAANDMVAGRSVEVAPLVVSLRQFIRAALDLEPIPTSLAIPQQGPLRPGGGGGSGASGRRGGAERGADAAGGRAGGGGVGAGGAGGGGSGGAMALGVGAHSLADETPAASSTQ
ncbi:hypothetical protein CBP36_09785 [Acidovorax carolinensis]|uniref:Uncharacterized protein n=1 Tax=Acidovorax carolinensis TaxID=553814 RepID=A0A240UC66_9BURK|nr:hypothetical protein [Acidovorax carolinensis]ART55134.1 hypothetical protein CBP35_09140 [Acidovorax carolinensis]ART59101.1 hypothetical protein CBP36_09785 [Acidovorax carolinensis]